MLPKQKRPSQETSDLDRLRQFRSKGWCRFPFDPELYDWLQRSQEVVYHSMDRPENAHWYRYGNTWFVGVNALPNDSTGAVADGPALSGHVVNFIRQHIQIDYREWDKAQISVCFPGYPKPVEGESEASFRFRRDRDAAHIDGLLKDGAKQQRFLLEQHAFILGIPASHYDLEAAPFTIWEGSHHLIQQWLKQTYHSIPEKDWGHIDVATSYQQVRRKVFETCVRMKLYAQPGEAVLVHRHAVHGMAPWAKDAKADPVGRVILYFRPEAHNLQSWLNGE
jgi:hypothetical protein